MNTVSDWTDHYATTKPSSIALIQCETGETRTWSEFDKRVGQLASVLRDSYGIGEGDRVAQLTDSDIRVFELLFACMRIGAILVPLNFRLTPHELAALCQDVSCNFLITDSEWATVSNAVAREADIDSILSWTGGPDSDFDQAISVAEYTAARSGISSASAALILFTSGTTGFPKGAITTTGAIQSNFINQLETTRLGEGGAHLLSLLPLFHAGGLLSLAMPTLLSGGTVSVAQRFDPGFAVKYLSENQDYPVTHLALVPVMWQMIADAEGFPDADLSKMKTLLIAGGRLTDKIREAYAAKGLNFMTQYGGTETGPAVTSMNPERIDKIMAGSCGQKVMNVNIRLVDEEGKDVDVGEPGEVWLKGPSITVGYFNRNSADYFTEDGWFPMGDVARMDEEGFYYIVDRTKDMYKSGGENVYPAEIESVLITHPDIQEASVIGVADDQWGEVGLALVLLEQGKELTLEDIEAHCADKLARYKQPKRLVLVEDFPRNVTGKIEKNVLREQYGASKSA